MLIGERKPATAEERLACVILALVIALPLVLLGGGMILVGLLALGPRQDVSELWICLPAGLALLGLLAAALYYALVRVPSLTITRFVLDRDKLTIETPLHGCVTCPSQAVRCVSEVRSRRAVAGQKLKGWWLSIEQVGWVYLTRITPNAESLVAHVRKREP